MEEYGLFTILKKLLYEHNNPSESQRKQFNDVNNYSLGISFNPLGKNRMSTNPKYEFSYDMIQWLANDNINLTLNSFKLSSKKEMEFRFTKNQFTIIQDQLERFEDNIVAASKALFATTSIPSHYYWRKPFIKKQDDLIIKMT